VGTVRDALQLPDMRRIELGYGLSITGELAGTVALVVYALGAGGAALVAAYAASRTVAGMGVALVLTGVTSRLRPTHSRHGGCPPIRQTGTTDLLPPDLPETHSRVSGHREPVEGIREPLRGQHGDQAR
jgi:hypothetical protein